MPNQAEVQQPARRVDPPDEAQPQLDALRRETAQLREALASRIVIEQAKGVLAERYVLSVGDAFLLLRSSARSARVNIHRLAEQVVGSRESPPAVIRGLARDKRLRASAMREHNEATDAQGNELRSRHGEQLDRLARTRSAQSSTARIKAESRSDAVDLASRLGGYHWYLIVPDEEHWEVVVEFSGHPYDLPADLRARVDGWLRARSLQAAHVRIGDLELKLLAADVGAPEGSGAVVVR